MAPPRLRSKTKKKETVDRTDDPVRMYLREMGAVELLSPRRRNRHRQADRGRPGHDDPGPVRIARSPSTPSSTGRRSSTKARCSCARSSIPTRCCRRSVGPSSRGRRGRRHRRDQRKDRRRQLQGRGRARGSVRGRRGRGRQPAPRRVPATTRKRTTPSASRRWKERSSRRRSSGSPTSPRSTRSSQDPAGAPRCDAGGWRAVGGGRAQVSEAARRADRRGRKRPVPQRQDRISRRPALCLQPGASPRLAANAAPSPNATRSAARTFSTAMSVTKPTTRGCNRSQSSTRSGAICRQRGSGGRSHPR